MEFKHSNKYRIVNDVVIYNDTNENRFATLIDLDGFNNGDLFKYNNELFILVGKYLYGVTNSLKIEASISLVDNIEKIDIMRFILDKNYCIPKIYDSNCIRNYSSNLSADLIYNNIFDEEIILNNFLKLAFDNVVAYDEFIDNNGFSGLFSHSIYTNYDWDIAPNFDYKNQFIRNNSLITSGYDDNFIYRSILEKKDVKDYSEYKDNENIDLVDDFVEKFSKTKEFEDFIKEDKKIEKMEKQYFDRKNKYENISTFQEILNNIKRNGKVVKQLKSGISVFNLFLYKNTDIKINNIVDVDLIYKQKGLYDYSFLIMNFVKAVEIFLTYKLSKFDGEIQIYNKDKRKNEIVELKSDEFKKYSMLGNMINYLYDHSSEVFSAEFESQIINRFCLLIKDWKDKERNGYFHKHRIENVKEALDIILSSLQIIVGIELYLKK